MTGSAVVEVACGGAAHRVTVTEDRAGRARITLHDHDRTAEAVLTSLAGKPAPCMDVLAIIRSLRPVEPSPLERAQWVTIGVRTPDALAGWKKIGTAADVERWMALGVTDPETLAFFVAGDGDRWTLDDMEAWAAAGIPPCNEICWWERLGVTRPEQRHEWIDAGVKDGADAKDWAFFGGIRRPDDIRRWRQAGVADGGDFQNWLVADVKQPDDIAAWHDVGVRYGWMAAAWVRAHVAAAEIARWRDAGVDEPGEVEKWAVAGVSAIAQLAQWRASGIQNGDEAAAWVEPRLVTGLDEIRAWKAAGVTTPAAARALSTAGRTPASVFGVQLKARGLILKHRHEREGRAGWVLPAEGGGVIDVYFYAYGWPCGPDEATHWTSIHYRNGDEVPGSRTHGVVGRDDPRRGER